LNGRPLYFFIAFRYSWHCAIRYLPSFAWS
jgi:hypothetical protein